MIDFTALPLPGPEGRANAIRATLNQIAALPGAGNVEVYALQAAFEELSLPQKKDDASTTARRQTCGQIAAAIRASSLHNGGQYGLPGDATAAHPWFQAQIDAWSESSDPRQKAMAATASRELHELGG